MLPGKPKKLTTDIFLYVLKLLLFFNEVLVIKKKKKEESEVRVPGAGRCLPRVNNPRPCLPEDKHWQKHDHCVLYVQHTVLNS